MSTTKAELALRDNTGLALLVCGVAMVLFGALIVAEAAVATAVATVGALAMVLGALLPRLEGTVKLGPAGLELVLAAFEERSDQRGLPPEQRLDALAELLRSLNGDQPTERGGRRALPAPSSEVDQAPYVALVDAALDRASAMVDVPVTEVPPQAVEAVRQSASLPEAPEVQAAQRRAGRGAPRWHLRTSAGPWRVSNTRHGWTATPYEGPGLPFDV